MIFYKRTGYKPGQFLSSTGGREHGALSEDDGEETIQEAARSSPLGSVK